MGRILDRYYLGEVLKITFLMLFSFYSLYVLIDFTSRTVNFHLTFKQLVQYYGFLFFKRIDLLLPFALMVAGIRAVSLSNARSELIAAMAGGIPLKRLLVTLPLIGIFATIGIYMTSEWILPLAYNEINRVENSSRPDRFQEGQGTAVSHVHLPDQSLLVYSSYQPAFKSFSQAYWINSLDEVYLIKELFPFEDPPIGKQVVRLERDQDNRLIPVETDQEIALRGLVFDLKALEETLVPPLERSLSQLWSKRPQSKERMTRDEAEVEAAWHKRMALPWLCFVALMLPVPSCCRFSRQQKTFLIFCLSLFALFALYLTLSAGYTLAASDAIHPEWAISGPILVLLGIVFWRYYRL